MIRGLDTRLVYGPFVEVFLLRLPSPPTCRLRELRKHLVLSTYLRFRVWGLGFRVSACRACVLALGIAPSHAVQPFRFRALNIRNTAP